MAERVLTIDEIFHDLMVLTEASEIVRSEARMRAIRDMQRKQNRALDEAQVRTPLIDSLAINDIFRATQ